MEKINDTITKAKNEVKELIKAAQEKQLEAELGRTMMESFENSVNQARDDAGSIVHKRACLRVTISRLWSLLDPKEVLSIFIDETACAGQQNVEGKRIPYGFIDRTLPHFTKDDYGPESRGSI